MLGTNYYKTQHKRRGRQDAFKFFRIGSLAVLLTLGTNEAAGFLGMFSIWVCWFGLGSKRSRYTLIDASADEGSTNIQAFGISRGVESSPSTVAATSSCVGEDVS